MTKTQNNNIDEQLADFTDKILSEKNSKMDEAPFISDPELHALTQTALRLKNAVPDDGPSDVIIQRMRKNIAAQWKRQENKASETFWEKLMRALRPPNQGWQPQHNRQRWNVAIYLAAAFALMLVSIPLLNGISPNQSAASGQSLNAGLLAASGGLVLLAIWIIRRKR